MERKEHSKNPQMLCTNEELSQNPMYCLSSLAWMLPVVRKMHSQGSNSILTCIYIVQLGQSLTLKLVYTTTTHHKLFSQKGYCYSFEILHRVNTHKKNKIWGEKKNWRTPSAPLVVEFLGFSSVRVGLSCACARGVFMRTDPSSFPLHPLPFILHPSSFSFKEEVRV